MAGPRPAASSSSQSGGEEWQIRLLKRAGVHGDSIQGSPCERPPPYRLQSTVGSNSGFSRVLTIAGFINQIMCRGSESSTRPRGWTRQRCVEDPHTLRCHLLHLNFLDSTWPQAPAIADCPQDDHCPGPSGCGKSTLLLAFAGKLNKDLKALLTIPSSSRISSHKY